MNGKARVVAPAMLHPNGGRNGRMVAPVMLPRKLHGQRQCCLRFEPACPLEAWGRKMRGKLVPGDFVKSVRVAAPAMLPPKAMEEMKRKQQRFPDCVGGLQLCFVQGGCSPELMGENTVTLELGPVGSAARPRPRSGRGLFSNVTVTY